MRVMLGLLLLVPFTGCRERKNIEAVKDTESTTVTQTPAGPTLAEARKQAKPPAATPMTEPQTVEPPPAGELQLVKYSSAVGPLAAYVSPNPKPGRRHPAIIWITGGDCNSIDSGVFRAGPPRNDQSAIVFRQSGIITMYPSLRGGNTRSGKAKEGFYGEIDDVLAAAKYLASLDYVDSTRIYLGGHSTGGTIALLTSEYTDKFRAVLSLGPVDNVRDYGPDYLPPGGLENAKDFELRSPMYWLHGIKSPTFVLEGSNQGNLNCLLEMKKTNSNPMCEFFPVTGGTHFNIVQPMCKLFAQKILADTDLGKPMTITPDEVRNAMLGK